MQPKKLGFTNDTSEKTSYVDMKNKVLDDIKHMFRPEFLNRIDDIVIFNSLTEAELRQIIDLLLKPITEKLAEKGATLNVSDAAKEVILREGYDIKYGARPLKRSIQIQLEDKLAGLALKGLIKDGTTINVDAKDGQIEIITY